VKKEKELRKVKSTQVIMPASIFLVRKVAREYNSIFKHIRERMLGIFKACGKGNPRYSRLPAIK
jgi:hypothetical protein